jgi:hypothetical protein
LLYTTFNPDQPAVGGWAWAMVAFLLGSRTQTVPSYGPRRWPRLASSSLLAIIGAVGAERLIADAAAARCLSEGIAGRFQTSESACQIAMSLSPYECGYRTALADLLLRSDARRSADLLRPCLDLEPANAAVHHGLGQALLHAGTSSDSVEALRELKTAVDLAPWSEAYARDLRFAAPARERARDGEAGGAEHPPRLDDRVP